MKAPGQGFSVLLGQLEHYGHTSEFDQEQLRGFMPARLCRVLILKPWEFLGALGQGRHPGQLAHGYS